MVRFVDFLIGLVFPPLCLGCGEYLELLHERRSAVCEGCAASIPLHVGFFCPVCKRRLLTPHNDCHAASGFSMCALSFYDHLVTRRLVHALKYQNIKKVLNVLRPLFFSYFDLLRFRSYWALRSVCIVPIPLSTERERQRGFNQSSLIARIVHEYLIRNSETPLAHPFGRALEGACPRLLSQRGAQAVFRNTKHFVFLERALRRVRATRPQVELSSHEEREANVRGCFALSDPELVKGKDVILVDDVFTSGATMREAVKLLKKAGARRILGVVIASARG